MNDFWEYLFVAIIIAGVSITALLIAGSISLTQLEAWWSPYGTFEWIMVVVLVCLGLTVGAAKLWEHFS